MKCGPAAGRLSWASARQPSFPRQPPCLPSWGLTQETLQPAPRPHNSSDALQRPPFVLHSSNQLPTHIFSPPALRHRATSHLYANYFATWTKVIMLSDRKLTGPKSRVEINKLTPLNDRDDGHACWGQRRSADRQPARWAARPPAPRASARAPGETTSPQQKDTSGTQLTYPVSGCIL